MAWTGANWKQALCFSTCSVKLDVGRIVGFGRVVLKDLGPAIRHAACSVAAFGQRGVEARLALR
jgi:hypothetical protein